jgi:hypothetical protein
MKAWILREQDYYDADSTTVGITLNPELAKFWDTIQMCYTEEIEIDSPDLMRECRISGQYGMGNGGFEAWKAAQTQKVLTNKKNRGKVKK